MSIDYSNFAFPKNKRIKNQKLIDNKKITRKEIIEMIKHNKKTNF